jgi:DNA repair exonuclease SbcCD ATPase subunit
MENEITSEELGQIIRAARVLAMDFSEEQLKSLLIAQQKLADSGFLEVAWGMVRLQKEQGISCSEALDANQKLLKQKGKLESELAILKDRVTQEQIKHSEAKKIHQQMVDNIKEAKSELEAVQSDVQKEQNQLSSLRKRSETEKGRIEKELERRKKNAGVSSEEIVTAGQLKTEVVKSGFAMETMLGLVQEFAPYNDARDRLAGALKTGQSLTEYLDTLEKKSEEKKREVRTDIDQLLNRKSAEEREVKRLEQARGQLQINVTQLHADLDEEQSLRQFYVRYSPLSKIMEYLMNWKEVYYLRCENPGCAPFAGITRFWTDRKVSQCPHCGSGLIKPDADLFRLLDMPAGTVFSLK